MSAIPKRGQDATARSENSCFDMIVGCSAAVLELKRRLARIATTDVNVLITGETGTGKELVAEAIHRTSARHIHNFVTVNCAALPDTLFESELFGHARGAFTGAFQARAGKLKHSNGGTVFLDEIGELSLVSQAKLLRAIESREIQLLGQDATYTSDFRLIAATNQVLEDRMAEGLFRQDLYYRLNVARVHVPPLRDRIDDLALLIPHWLGRLNQKFAMEIDSVSAAAMQVLSTYAFPGNVRELKNILESAYLDVQSRVIEISDLPEHFQPSAERQAASALTEKDRLLGTLRQVNWNKSEAAKQLRWSRMTLYRKLAKYEVEVPAQDGDSIGVA